MELIWLGLRFWVNDRNRLLWVVLCLIVGLAGKRLSEWLPPLPAPTANKPQEVTAKNKWILITRCLGKWGYPFPLFRSPAHFLGVWGIRFCFHCFLSSWFPANSGRTGEYSCFEFVSVLSLVFLPGLSFGNKASIYPREKCFHPLLK